MADAPSGAAGRVSRCLARRAAMMGAKRLECGGKRSATPLCRSAQLALTRCSIGRCFSSVDARAHCVVPRGNKAASRCACRRTPNAGATLNEPSGCRLEVHSFRWPPALNFPDLHPGTTGVSQENWAPAGRPEWRTPARSPAPGMRVAAHADDADDTTAWVWHDFLRNNLRPP